MGVGNTSPPPRRTLWGAKLPSTPPARLSVMVLFRPYSMKKEMALTITASARIKYTNTRLGGGAIMGSSSAARVNLLPRFGGIWVTP